MLIDNQIVEQARNADVIAFLERHGGLTFKPMGGAYRCEQHKSLAVKADRLSWFWHSKGIGGHGILDYLTKVEGLAFREAVETVTGLGVLCFTEYPKARHETAPQGGQVNGRPLPPTDRANLARSAEPPKVLVLPRSAGIMLKLYDYLCVKRGIDGDIVNALIQEKKLYQDYRGNVVFVGHDEQGKARFASMRGTRDTFRRDCAGSNKCYGFNTASPDSDQLYVYESPIDLMSAGSMENAIKGDKDAWRRRSRLSLAGTSDAALPFFLNQHKRIKELVFCLDNDSPGRVAANVLSRIYAEKGYYTRIEPPYHKDCNEDLLALREQIKAQKRTKPLRRGVDI